MVGGTEEVHHQKQLISLIGSTLAANHPTPVTLSHLLSRMPPLTPPLQRKVGADLSIWIGRFHSSIFVVSDSGSDRSRLVSLTEEGALRFCPKPEVVAEAEEKIEQLGVAAVALRDTVFTELSVEAQKRLQDTQGVAEDEATAEAGANANVDANADVDAKAGTADEAAAADVPPPPPSKLPSLRALTTTFDLGGTPSRGHVSVEGFKWVADEKGGNLAAHGLATGHAVWPCGMLLCDWLVEQADLGCMDMSSILELGCGLGLAGLVAAALCPNGRCVLTDGDEAVTLACQKSIDANASALKSTARVSARVLWWGDDATMGEMLRQDRKSVV